MWWKPPRTRSGSAQHRRASSLLAFGAGVESLEVRLLLTHELIPGLGVAGDGLSDEYTAEDYSYARSWVQIVAEELHFDLGPEGSWGGPRRTGYAYNWALAGASSGDLVAGGQHTGLSAQVTAGEVSHVVLAIGQDDFLPGGPLWNSIYSGEATTAQLSAHVSAISADIELAAQTLHDSGAKIVLANVIDYGIAPGAAALFPNAVSRERVAAVVRQVNERLIGLAQTMRVPLVDLFGLTRDLFGTNQSPVGVNTVGGVALTTTAGVAATNAFVDDGLHPHTVTSAVLANACLAGFKLGYGDGFHLLTERQIVEAAGLTYESDTFGLNLYSYVRLPDPVERVGTTVHVFGTFANDTITVTIANPYRVTVNGRTWQFDPDEISRFQIDGDGGYDSLTIHCGSGNDAAELEPGRVLVRGAGYSIEGNAETVTVRGGGGVDRATLRDSPGNDRLSARARDVRLSGEGFRNTVEGFAQVTAFSTSPGDAADFFGSPGDDVLILSPTQARLSGAGAVITANGFSRVLASATSGGHDEARLSDSPGNDRLSVSPGQAELRGPGFIQTLLGFHHVTARSTAGGNDQADLYDSPADDRASLKPTYTEIVGSGYFARAIGFATARAHAVAGGHDRADLYDAEGDDTFTANDVLAVMSGAGYQTAAAGFERVFGYAARGGNDRAFLYDSIGNDRLLMKAGYSRLSGPGFYNYVRGFDRVDAFATAGGDDRADLYDSPGDDEFVGRPESARLSGAGFMNVARGFARAFAHAIYGGDDRALLYDSAGDDRYASRPSYARLDGVGFLLETRAFGTVVAAATTGNDRAILVDFRTGERVSGAGGLFRGDRATRRERLTGFDEIRAKAEAGQTPTSTIDPLAVDYTFSHTGTWL